MNGERLRMMMKRKGVSSKELAEAIGVNTSTVQVWQINKNEPKARLLADVVDYLKCWSIDYLMERDGYDNHYKEGKYNTEEVKERLIRLREESGLSYRELNKEIGITIFFEIEESGLNKSDIFLALCIADYFNVSLDWLLRGAE